MQSIKINISTQTLSAFDDSGCVFEYRVSTAIAGAGEDKNSGCTPRGKHIIRAKIGAKAALNSVFIGRRLTGEIYSDALSKQFPNRDWILSRILWLSGTEIGKNRLGSKDTMQRYVYLHGTPDSQSMGLALSHGCIRLRNSDIVSLFDWANVGCSVEIDV